jgi:colicin import membrane protein
VKVDKTLAASIGLHVLVIAWGMVSFSARSLEAPPPESMPVDIISADELSKITAGSKTGEKDKPKPQAKAAPPKPPEPKRERTFDQSKIAALLDKRDPTRHAATGETLNSTASLGASRGTAATLSQSELDALRARLTKLWNVQAGTERPEELIVDIRIRLTPDKRLASPPEIVSRGSSPRYQAAADAAMRAVLQGQPYDMLQPSTYDQWKDMIVTFDPRQIFNG